MKKFLIKYADDTVETVEAKDTRLLIMELYNNDLANSPVTPAMFELLFTQFSIQELIKVYNFQVDSNCEIETIYELGDTVYDH